MIGLLTIEPALAIVLSLTNPIHNFFYLSRGIIPLDGNVYLTSEFGPGFWLHAAYSYALMAAGAVLLIRAFIRSPGLYRGQIAYLLIGTFTPWLANAVYILGFSPLPQWVDLTPIAFTITGLTFGWSLYRYRLLDILPVARDTVFESIEEVVLVIDRDNRVVDANGAALALLGKSASEVIGSRAVEALADQMTLVDRFRNVYNADTQIAISVGKQQRAYQLRLTPLTSRQGDIVGRVAVLTDVTVLQQALQKAEDANRLKTEFLATISHELRTPLGAVLGYTELMLTGMTGEIQAEHRRNLDRIRSNANDLLALINNLLDVAKIEAGRVVLRNTAFSSQAWMDEIIAETRTLADAKGLQFEVALDSSVPEFLQGDPEKLRQIVLVLISNAVKFTDKGQVEVSVNASEKGWWNVAVTDTGIGIPVEAQTFIFEPFRQVDGSYSRKHGGTGLGLAIVQNLVTLMGGTVVVKSEPGAGSTFTVRLPLLPLESQVGVDKKSEEYESS
jgi:PAS domain S-box-containing protein